MSGLLYSSSGMIGVCKVGLSDLDLTKRMYYNVHHQMDGEERGQSW